MSHRHNIYWTGTYRSGEEVTPSSQKLNIFGKWGHPYVAICNLFSLYRQYNFIENYKDFPLVFHIIYIMENMLTYTVCYNNIAYNVICSENLPFDFSVNKQKYVVGTPYKYKSPHSDSASVLLDSFVYTYM